MRKIRQKVKSLHIWKRQYALTWCRKKGYKKQLFMHLVYRAVTKNTGADRTDFSKFLKLEAT